jgi:hypothetical protein
VRRRDRLALAAALVPAGALLFAAGVWVGGRAGGEAGDGRAPDAAETRAVYSPDVLSDPWFLTRQRENVAALERSCAEHGELCEEARAARRWLDEQAANP